MSKYCRRLAARTSLLKLQEAAKEAKNWIMTKRLILETEEGDMEFEAGDAAEIGATPEGDMAIKGEAAVVVISDADLASKIADMVVSADELSDVKFVEKPAIDAVMDGEQVDNVIDKLADDEDENVEVAELDIEQKESVEAKFEKFSAHRMNPSKFLVCESIQVEAEDPKSLNMAKIKLGFVAKESFDDHAKFMARVSELNGSVQPGKREVALTEAGEVMGAYDTEENFGEIYPENSFENVEAMEAFDDEPADLMQDFDFEMEDDNMDLDFNAVEESLKAYEESAKSGADYMKMVEALSDKKLGLKESTVANIVATFNDNRLTECVRAFDTKYGKFVAAFKESTDINNWISESGDEKRFTKRYFA